MSETTLNLNSEEYNDFLRCLTNLKEICNDVNMQNGVIRQRSNDKSSIFVIDLNSLVGDATFSIADLKKKLDLLKTFAGQDVEISITEGDENTAGFFTFSDEYSSLKFLSPSLTFVDNKYMTDDELQSIFTLNDEDLILDCDLTNIITDRIRVITTSFNTLAIQVNFDGDKASISASTPARDQFAKFVQDIEANVEMEKCSANISTIPFGIEHDTDVEFKMYKDPEQPVTLNKFATNLGDIEFVVYTRSSIVGGEDED